MKIRKLTLTAALLAGALSLISAASAQAATPDGAKVFTSRCSACHAIAAGKPAGIGPNLAGVVGRGAAKQTFNYSPALKKSGLTWTRVNLDKYIAGPMKLVPGTRMSVVISDPAQRKALIDYLSKMR